MSSAIIIGITPPWRLRWKKKVGGAKDMDRLSSEAVEANAS
jgi:hypothetical protein